MPARPVKLLLLLLAIAIALAGCAAPSVPTQQSDGLQTTSIGIDIPVLLVGVGSLAVVFDLLLFPFQLVLANDAAFFPLVNHLVSAIDHWVSDDEPPEGAQPAKTEPEPDSSAD